jgi:hypothetical protein
VAGACGKREISSGCYQKLKLYPALRRPRDKKKFWKNQVVFPVAAVVDAAAVTAAVAFAAGAGGVSAVAGVE